jgi:hypothetical protein
LIRALNNITKEWSSLDLDDAKLKGKALKETTQEVREILQRLEFDDNGVI